MKYLTAMLFAFVLAGAAQGQEGSSDANVVFARAIGIYSQSLSQDEAAREQAAQEVLRLFDLIVQAI